MHEHVGHHLPRLEKGRPRVGARQKWDGRIPNQTCRHIHEDIQDDQVLDDLWYLLQHQRKGVSRSVSVNVTMVDRPMGST